MLEAIGGMRVDVSCSTETLAAIFLRALPCDLVLAHRRTVFLPWTCGYRRGATAVAVALEDDPRLRQESDRLLYEDDRPRPLHRRALRWTRLLQLFFRYTARLVVTIRDHLLAWLPGLCGRNFELLLA